jgi:tight adherence protein B
MNVPLFVGLLVTVAALFACVAIWRLKGPRDPVDERLQRYGGEGGDFELEQAAQKRTLAMRLNQVLTKLDFGKRLAKDLVRADMPLTPGEFAVICAAISAVGFLIGTVRLGVLLGLVLAGVTGYLPFFYLQSRQKKRQQLFTQQLPDVLTLLVASLQAGYGLTQAMQVLVDQMPTPASDEFAQVVRGVSLGVSMPHALNDMVERVGTNDVELAVTAIAIQHELGGNLAQTLEIIGDTVRDRIRLQQEKQVMTAQQRFTGLVLGLLPFGLGILLFMINPHHMSRLFEGGVVRILLVGAGVMQMVGLLVIRKILDIDV